MLNKKIYYKEKTFFNTLLKPFIKELGKELTENAKCFELLNNQKHIIYIDIDKIEVMPYYICYTSHIIKPKQRALLFDEYVIRSKDGGIILNKKSQGERIIDIDEHFKICGSISGVIGD